MTARKSKPPDDASRVSLRAFGRLIGVTDKAVRKAVISGRLRESVGYDRRKRPYIADAALASKEWAQNAAKAPKGVGRTALADVQVSVGAERARKLKMDNDIREGLRPHLPTVTKLNFEAARTVRENLLNLPARLSAELAAETDPARVYARLEAEIRQALTAIADQLKEMSLSVVA